MDISAVQNFKSVDRFLSDVTLGAVPDVHALGREQTRVLLRHLVAEQNRFYFEHWEYLEIVLGSAFLFLLVLGSRPPRVAILLCAAMMAIVLGQRIGLTPQIERLGRTLDFVPAAAAGDQGKAFWMLHGIYSGVELLKIALGLGIAGLLTIRPKPDRKQFAKEVELDEGAAPRQAR